MSFAIFETGGKQYKASASKIIEIEKLDAEIGKTIQFKNILLLNDSKTTEIGNPNVDGAVVEAKLLDNVKDRTVLIFHKRRRKHSRKMNGHRQRHSKIQITKILSKDGKIIAEDTPENLILKHAPDKPKEVVRGNMEDVFIALTGHGLRD
jgi:large subunit ribosomal protein L21